MNIKIEQFNSELLSKEDYNNLVNIIAWSKDFDWINDPKIFLSGERSIIYYLNQPFEKDDVIYKFIKIKGHHYLEKDNDNIKLKIPETRPYHGEGRPVYSYDVNDKGDLIFIPTREMPLGAMLLKDAKLEYDVLNHLFLIKCVNNVPFPIGYGSFPDLEFEGKQTGFTVMAMPTNNCRFSDLFFHKNNDRHGSHDMSFLFNDLPELAGYDVEEIINIDIDEKNKISKIIYDLINRHFIGIKNFHLLDIILIFTHLGNSEFILKENNNKNYLDLLFHDFESVKYTADFSIERKIGFEAFDLIQALLHLRFISITEIGKMVEMSHGIFEAGLYGYFNKNKLDNDLSNNIKKVIEVLRKDVPKGNSKEEKKKFLEKYSMTVYPDLKRIIKRNYDIDKNILNVIIK